MGLVNTKTPEKTELALLKLIPKKYLPHAHHLLILHGRYTCMARSPNCQACGVSKYCEYTEKTIDWNLRKHMMEYRRFGKTNKKISVITLGGMRYKHGWEKPKEILPH